MLDTFINLYNIYLYFTGYYFLNILFVFFVLPLILPILPNIINYLQSKDKLWFDDFILVFHLPLTLLGLYYYASSFNIMSYLGLGLLFCQAIKVAKTLVLRDNTYLQYTGKLLLALTCYSVNNEGDILIPQNVTLYKFMRWHVIDYYTKAWEKSNVNLLNKMYMSIGFLSMSLLNGVIFVHLISSVIGIFLYNTILYVYNYGIISWKTPDSSNLLLMYDNKSKYDISYDLPYPVSIMILCSLYPQLYFNVIKESIIDIMEKEKLLDEQNTDVNEEDTKENTDVNEEDTNVDILSTQNNILTDDYKKIISDVLSSTEIKYN